MWLAVFSSNGVLLENTKPSKNSETLIISVSTSIKKILGAESSKQYGSLVRFFYVHH